MDTRTHVRETLRLAVPITLAQIALMTMGLVDAALVGRVSERELAAVSIGNALFFAIICPAMGVTMAVEPMASQAIGAGDEKKAWQSLQAALAASLLLSAVTMVVAALCTLVLAHVGIDPDVVPLAQRFMLARLPGVPGWLAFLCAKAFLEAKGITRPLMIGGWVSNVVNLVVAAVLVYGDGALLKVGLPAMGLPSLGSLGAGFTTSVSNLLLAAIALTSAYAARPRGETLFGVDRESLVETVRKVMRVGIPIGFQFLTEVGVFAVAGVLVGRFGARSSAAHQIAIGLASFTFMGVIGLGGATSVRVGRAVGEGGSLAARRAGLVGVGIGALYMVLCALGFLLMPRALSSLFSDSPEVIEVAVQLLAVAAAFQLFDGVQGVAGGALRGAGDSRFASVANVACHWLVGLPVALLLGFKLQMGAVGMWWGLSLGLFVVAFVLLARFLRVSSRPIEAL